MITSVNAEKSFGKIQHPFIIKTLDKVGVEGMYLSIIKAIYMTSPELTSHSTVKSGKHLLLRSGIRQGCPLSLLLFNSIGSPSHSNQRRKRNKRNTNWKRSKAVTVCR